MTFEKCILLETAKGSSVYKMPFFEKYEEISAGKSEKT